MNMTNAEKLALSEKVSELKGKVMLWLNEDSTRSQAKLANTVRLNEATLSTFLGSKCTPKTLRNVIEKLEPFFQMQSKKINLLPEPKFVPISQSNRIRNFISMIHLTRGIGVLHGSSGVSKTRTTRKYMDDNPNTYRISVNPMIRSKVTFFKMLAWDILGKKDISNPGIVFDEIATKCETQEALIAIDDAHLLWTDKSTDDSPFEIIRTLNDRSIAFVVMGNGSLRDKVTQTNKAEFYQQFASRAKVMEISHTFIEADVRAVIGSVLQSKSCEPEIFDYLYAMTNKFYGSLRVMVNTLQLAAFDANTRNEPLMLSHLEIAANTVIATLKPEAKTQSKGTLHAKRTQTSNNQSVNQKEELTSLTA